MWRYIEFHQTDPATGKRAVQTVAADAGEKLEAVGSALGAGVTGTAHRLTVAAAWGFAVRS